MPTNLTAGQEAFASVYHAKMPYQDAKNSYTQTLVSNAALTVASGGVTSKYMGNPTFVDVFLTASAAATFQIQHSKDGVKFYHDTGNDVTFAGAGDKIVRVFGAPFIKIVVSADQANAFVDLIAKF